MDLLFMRVENSQVAANVRQVKAERAILNRLFIEDATENAF